MLVLSKTAVVDGIVENGEVNDEEKRLRFVRNCTSVDIFHASLVYRLFSGNDDMTEGSVMQFSRLATLVVSFPVGWYEVQSGAGKDRKYTRILSPLRSVRR